MLTGLTLGKFAPLHLGHQYLVETALREVDHLIVIVYESKDVTPVPLPVRAAWIRRLYPEVEVIEGWGGPSDVGDTPEIEKLQEDYVRGLLQGRSITHFYSSESYGAHMSKAFGAADRMVDKERLTVPVSSTLVRQDPYAARAFLSPAVYRDLVTNIVFLGAPSTGKTTLCAALAEAYQTVWMPEYGREYWEQNQVDRRLSPGQLVEIAEGHIEYEERLLAAAHRYLFTDTNAITTYIFALYYHGSADPRLERLAHEAEQRYDLVFVCDTDIPYEDTWDRSGDANRQLFQRQIIEDLDARGVSYVLLRGGLEERMDHVRRVLDGYEKYR